MLHPPGSRSLGMVVHWDFGVTRLMNKSLALKGVKPFFAFISWLGNGKLWYLLLILLPIIFGSDGIRATAQMGIVGIANVMIFRLAKNSTRRPRPCNAYGEIRRGAAPLDEYSFPSGHTLHAVAFSAIACGWFPQLTVLLCILTGLIALSRVVLGLHYPTDVALGAMIGFAAAKLSFFL